MAAAYKDSSLTHSLTHTHPYCLSPLLTCTHYVRFVSFNSSRLALACSHTRVLVLVFVFVFVLALAFVLLSLYAVSWQHNANTLAVQQQLRAAAEKKWPPW